MPGKTLYLTPNPNNFKWPITDRKGKAFEALIHSYLRRTVATRDGRVKIIRTKTVGDAGRDFEVWFSGTVTLFGAEISARPRKKAKVFVECKSTERDRLDDAFIADASQHDESEAVLYVLVTNATLTPYYQYRAQAEWSRLNSNFRLFDRRRLVDELIGANMREEARRLGIILPSPSSLPKVGRDSLAVSCQLDAKESGEQAHIYVSLSNYGPQGILSQIGIATDLQWSSDRFPFERVVPPGGLETVHLTANRRNFEGPAELGLSLSLNGRSHRLTISKPDYQVTFEPPFTGKEHRRIRSEIRAIAENAQSFMLLSIQGEAGVGKTRTLNEAMAPLRHGKLETFTYNFTQDQSCPSFDNFFKTFNLPQEKSLAEKPSEKVADLIDRAGRQGEPVLLHFEDLHHADESVIKVFKELVIAQPTTSAALIIVVTGRDDHTFPNEEYYSFLQLIRDIEVRNVKTFIIQPLSDKEAKSLIRSVVTNMPELGVERIYELGQNNPFIIVEVLQYLLDSRLAQLLSRRTVGVLNPEVFAGRNRLPMTVEELYDRRLASLRGAVGGRLAIEFLTVASFFGFVISEDVRLALFDGEERGQEAWALLIRRRFVARDEASQQFTFAHENLLHHLRRVVRVPENAKQAAQTILKRDGLMMRLQRFEQGEVHYLNSNFEQAFSCFSEIWDRVKRITNFSSEEINKRYFFFLPMLFIAAKACGESREFLSRAALAYGYMGVHNYPLLLAEVACYLSSQMLSELFPRDRDGLRDKLAIRQLRAHALQNMGRTGLALKEMLEIEAMLIETKGDWPDVSFDLFDRLQEFYRKTNHAELCHFYGRQAKNSMRRAGDKKLRASHLITHSLVHLYLNEGEARKYSNQAHATAKRIGILRFITYTRLTELIVEVLYSKYDVEHLRGICEEARTMLRTAVIENFSDSIMRLELFLGTLALACYEEADERHVRARSYIESGQANSIRFGNGLFDWAFDNLAAVVDLEDRDKPEDSVRARFRSSLEKMRQRGLTFVGAQSGLYPNPLVISNVVRFFAGYRESTAVEVMKSNVSAYDNRFLEQEDSSLLLVARAAAGEPIFWPSKRQVRLLRYPRGTGYFTPIF